MMIDSGEWSRLSGDRQVTFRALASPRNVLPNLCADNDERSPIVTAG